MMMIMMATMTTKTTAMRTVNKDDDKDTNGEENNDLIFRHQIQPVVGFIPGMEEGDFDNDDDGNSNHKDER